MHGQEGDGQQRSRDQPRGGAEQRAAGGEQERDRQRPQHGGGDPGGLEDARAVGRHRLPHAGAAAEA